MAFKTDHISTLVETTTLPKITVSGKGEEQFDSYVNAYIVGSQPEHILGKLATPLYYLSLVAPYGHGTVLQGIFARLISSTSKGRGVHLQGVGDVVLAHHQQCLSTCGYTLHWNYEQAEVAPTREIHAIIESNMLTICDPVRGNAVKQRNAHAKARVGEVKKRARKERTSLSTAKKSRALDSLEELRLRERFPAFLLMIPGWQRGNATYRHQLHLSFLDPRVPWPLDPTWATFLWWRGEKRHEIEELTVWCSTPPAQEEGLPETVPFLSEAYLCRPNPAVMQRDIQEALTFKRLPSHLRDLSEVPQPEPMIAALAAYA